MPARTVKIEPPPRDIFVQSYVTEAAKGVGITLRHFFRNFFSRVPWFTLGAVAIVLGGLGAVTMLVVKAAVGHMHNLEGFLAVFGGLPASLGVVALVAGAARKYRRVQPPNYIRIRPYPDIPADYYAPRFRGEHRLMHREDGSVRCVSCMMCATVCPADCIHIVAGDAAAPSHRGSEVTPPAASEKFPVRFEIDELRCVVCGFCVEACPCDAIRMDSGRHVPAMSARPKFLFDREHLLASGGPSVAVQGGEGPGWRSRSAPPHK